MLPEVDLFERRNDTSSLEKSTDSVRNPAAIQPCFAWEWLPPSSLAHQARCIRAELGNWNPRMRSISRNPSCRESLSKCVERCSPRRAYFDTADSTVLSLYIVLSVLSYYQR